MEINFFERFHIIIFCQITKMSKYSLNFKVILVFVLFLNIIESNYCTRVDSFNCINYDKNAETVYPIVSDPKVRYYLFTQKNFLDGQEIKDQDVNSVTNSNFNRYCPTRIYIGDWKIVPNNCKTALVKDSYLNIGNFNFIIVDWSDWSGKDYLGAKNSVNDVGNSLGSFTQFLNTNFDVQYCNMYLIGQGMGAHVAGAAANFIAPAKYDTIFALDAAGPGFAGMDPSQRLDPLDANYVEAIFTDMFLWGYGAKEPIGQAQFFPNNGVRRQPHCPCSSLITQLCSHSAAVDYFANSLWPLNRFCGTETTLNDVFSGNIPTIDKSCCITMGGEPSKKKSGDFYLQTSNCWPLPPWNAQSLSVTVDSNNCDNGDILTVYPNVTNPKVRYYLFKSENLTEGVEIQDQNATSLEASKFDKNLPTRICVSCWKSKVNNCKTAIIKDAYLKAGNYNFIVADWSDWNTKDYVGASSSVKKVGTLIGKFTKFLNCNGASYSNMYLIGHDIGAHVAGAAGQSIAPNKYKTIYGLDPSNIGFDGASPENRLDPTDAEYVEVLSTDVFQYGYGANAPIGHAVLLPNNGRRPQLGCPTDPNSAFDINKLYCSHASAADIFASTLENTRSRKLCGIQTTWLNMRNEILPPTCAPCNHSVCGEPSVPKTGYFYVPRN
ncbi:uncharacterized protein LOC129615200 [Condylostylus longicornis]|uniref:uncharacterized protein LOC129615200 n=1 Tax=Condylostylus longicornis TaxID=2530218 RepID=UPI00244E4C55|nr:uncharacterized protein LOC129615200 [Condylostylus longicornis]